MRVYEDRLMIPSSARVFLIDHNSPSISLGRPSDLTDRIIKEEDARKLTVRLNGPLYDMSGVVSKQARPESDAHLDLVTLAGVHASVAAGMLRDAAQRPGETHTYLVKRAAYEQNEEEENALSSLTFAPQPQTDKTYMDPEQLRNQGKTLARGVNDQSDDLAKDRKLAEEIMNMTGFREITSDMVRQCTSTMNEMGQLLLRVLLHTEEYEDRFGAEDAERLKAKCLRTFLEDGDMALFLREKRGVGGSRDDEGALANLLSEDMGSSGSEGGGGGVGSV